LRRIVIVLDFSKYIFLFCTLTFDEALLKNVGYIFSILIDLKKNFYFYFEN